MKHDIKNRAFVDGVSDFFYAHGAERDMPLMHPALAPRVGESFPYSTDFVKLCKSLYNIHKILQLSFTCLRLFRGSVMIAM